MRSSPRRYTPSRPEAPRRRYLVRDLAWRARRRMHAGAWPGSQARPWRPGRFTQHGRCLTGGEPQFRVPQLGELPAAPAAAPVPAAGRRGWPARGAARAASPIPGRGPSSAATAWRQNRAGSLSPAPSDSQATGRSGAPGPVRQRNRLAGARRAQTSISPCPRPSSSRSAWRLRATKPGRGPGTCSLVASSASRSAAETADAVVATLRLSRSRISCERADHSSPTPAPCLPETAPVRVGDTQAWCTSGGRGIKWFSQRRRFTETSAALAPLRRTE